MTARERKAVCRYLRYLLDRLGLRDWRVDLMKEPSEEDKMATIGPIYGRKVAQLWLCRCFREHSPDEQRRTLVHECLHLHFHDIVHYMDETFDVLMGKPAGSASREAIRLALEHGVDGLAEHIDRLLDPIDWSDRRTYRR